MVSLQHTVNLSGEVFYILFGFRNVLKQVMCQISYNDLPVIRKEYQMAPIGVYSLNVMKDMEIALYIVE